MTRTCTRYPQSVKDAAVRRYLTTGLSCAVVAEEVACQDDPPSW